CRAADARVPRSLRQLDARAHCVQRRPGSSHAWEPGVSADRDAPVELVRRRRDEALRREDPRPVALAGGVLLQHSAVMHEQRGLRAIGELELAEDVRDVRFHGPLADAELRADLLIRSTARDQSKYLALARREV